MAKLEMTVRMVFFLVSISSTFYARVFCTNVILAAFSSYMYVEKAAEAMFVRKIRLYNVDEIDGKSTYKSNYFKFPF